MFKILSVLIIAVVSFQAKADELSDFKKARISFTAPKGWIRCERITRDDGALGIRATRYGKHQIEKKGNSYVSTRTEDANKIVVESRFRTRIGEKGGYPLDKFDKGPEQVEYVNLRKLCNDHRALFEGDTNVSVTAKPDADDDDKDNSSQPAEPSAPAPNEPEN
jgi:hypothetical protein